MVSCMVWDHVAQVRFLVLRPKFRASSSAKEHCYVYTQQGSVVKVHPCPPVLQGNYARVAQRSEQSPLVGDRSLVQIQPRAPE